MSTQRTNTLTEYSRIAAETIDEKRIPAASALHRAAHALESRTTNWTPAQKAARGLHDAACYVRDHDLDTMRTDLGRTVRRNPGYSLLAAAGAGFLVARALFRR